MKNRLILVCAETHLKNIYLDHLKPLDVDVDAVSSLIELWLELTDHTCMGVMIDIRTKLRTPRRERKLIDELLEAIPVALLQYEKNTATVRVSYVGQRKGGGSIEDFVNKECRREKACVAPSCHQSGEASDPSVPEPLSPQAIPLSALRTARVIMACGEEKFRKIYLERLKPLEVTLDVVSSLSELHRKLTEFPYNGVLIDLKTKMKAKSFEKDLVNQILAIFPVIQLQYQEKTGLIQTLFMGKAHGKGTLEDFVQKECLSSEKRSIRRNRRYNMHFNVTLSRNGHFSEKDPVQTITIDISRGGCFLFSVDQWEIGEIIHFIIEELTDRHPVQGEVRWRLAWGKKMGYPGIGVQFRGISAAQLTELSNAYGIS